MSSPVNSSPISSYASHVEEKKKDVKEGEGHNTEIGLLGSTFQPQMFEGNKPSCFTAGCGGSEQDHIDAAWQMLQNFIEKRPEFEDQPPSDMAAGLAEFAADARRNGDNC
ncbi:MAG: hypothetical protein VX777_02045 [Chlamydiota bacterium]|nr:hypothetical protein [Chlamydiota bacterium]